MTDPENETRVPSDELFHLVTDVFERCNMDKRDASLLAGTLCYADLTGVHSHGVLRVPEYVGKLTHGGVNPQGRPALVRDSGACLVVDGGNSMGQIGTAVRHGSGDRAGADDRYRGGRRSGEVITAVHSRAMPRRAIASQHDRHCHNERPADDGPVGRRGAAARHQPARHRHTRRARSRRLSTMPPSAAPRTANPRLPAEGIAPPRRVGAGQGRPPDDRSRRRN